MKTLLAVLSLAALVSCSSLDRYERTYSASVDADSQSGSLSVTLRPLNPPPAQVPVPSYASAMDDATIEKIIKLMAGRMEKVAQTPDITETPPLSGK